MEQSKKRNKRLWKRLCTAVIVFFCVLGCLVLWNEGTERQVYVKPDYEKKSIGHLLDKEILEDTDYKLLFLQTGLGRTAVDFLRINNRQQELEELQDLFFAEVEVKCKANTIVTREERIAEVKLPIKDRGRVDIPYLEKGDILITFNCHALGWRNGHAAMVVDAEERLAVEARMLGTDSSIGSMAHWERYPSFAVLRLNGISKEQREKIADYAAENLVDVPYRLESGIWERIWKNEKEEALTGTHCAHLIWYAYQNFGYDLDSDGGIVVTPRDLYESPLLEIIQIYGMPYRNY